MKRCLILNLETSALSPEVGDIVRFRAESISDPDDEFDEWAKPSRPLSAEAERVLGITNDKLSQCRSVAAVLGEFLDFLMPPVS